MYSNVAKLTWLVAVSSLCSIALSACGGRYAERFGDASSQNQLTVGSVQREIRVGMSGAEVVGILGSPNVVTTDDLRREVWVYDKISTESAFTTIDGGVRLMRLDFGASASRSSTTQKTLTVVLKFDEYSAVRDFAYHYSKF